MTSSWGYSWSQSWGNAWGPLVRPEQDGRSGYWRLFFHQLQERALQKKPAQKKPEPKLEPVLELKDGSAIVGEPQKKSRIVEAKPETPEREPPFRPKLTVVKQEVETPNYLVETMRLSMEVSRLFTSWQIPLIIAQAQDVEDEELLLLLAA